MYCISDGIREKDKKSLSSILSQVAVMKDNVYTLAKGLYQTEVNPVWSFYTETDKQLLKRYLFALYISLITHAP